MGVLRIEKNVSGKHETTIHVPTFLVRMATALLPEAALAALAAKGLDVRAIAGALRRGTSCSTSVDVLEHGVEKRVVVSLRGV